MALERVGQRAVDRERERQRLGRRLARGGVAARELRPRRPASAARAAASPPRRVSSCGRRAAASATLAHRARASRGTPRASSRAGAQPGRDEPRGGREQRVALEVGADVGGRAVGRLDVGARVAEVANGAEVEHRRPPRLAHPVRELARERASAPRGRRRRRSRSGSPARLESALATQPDGDGTLIPRPLSSQTKSSGTGRRWWAACAAVLSAACAVAWFSEASPKLQTTIASAGQVHATPSLRARSIAIATPTARGRCEAIVEVCGITASSWWPNTLCRPPAIGSSMAAATPSITSGTPSRSDLGRAREVEGARAVVQQRRDRSGAAPARRRRCSRALPSRSSRSCGAPSAASAPRGRSSGSRSAPARALRRPAPARRRRRRAGSSVSSAARRCCSSGSRSSGVIVGACGDSAEEGERAKDAGVDRLLPHDGPAGLDLAVQPGRESVGVLAGVGADDQVLPLADRAIALGLELLLELRSPRGASRT